VSSSPAASSVPVSGLNTHNIIAAQTQASASSCGHGLCQPASGLQNGEWSPMFPAAASSCEIQADTCFSTYGLLSGATQTGVCGTITTLCCISQLFGQPGPADFRSARGGALSKDRGAHFDSAACLQTTAVCRHRVRPRRVACQQWSLSQDDATSQDSTGLLPPRAAAYTAGIWFACARQQPAAVQHLTIPPLQVSSLVRALHRVLRVDSADIAFFDWTSRSDPWSLQQ